MEVIEKMEITEFTAKEIEEIRRQVNEIIDLAIEKYLEIIKNRESIDDERGKPKRKSKVLLRGRQPDMMVKSMSSDESSEHESGEQSSRYFPPELAYYDEEGWHEGGVVPDKHYYDRRRTGTIVYENQPFFYLEWCFGINAKTPIINLNQNLVYSAAQVGIIQNCFETKFKILYGHANPITALVEGKDYIATADEGYHKPSIILWDKESFIPIRMIVLPAPGTRLLCISSEEAVIYAASSCVAENSVVIRRWSSTDAISKGEIINPDDYIIDLLCIENEETYCIATYTYTVYIVSGKYQQLTIKQLPLGKSRHRIGKYRKSCWTERKEIVVGTHSGQIVVWDQEGNYVKTVLLLRAEITWIGVIKGKLIVSFDNGTIGFYSQDFIANRWVTQNVGIIRCIDDITGPENPSGNPNIIFSTSKGTLAAIDDFGESHLIFEGCGTILSLAYHPFLQNLIVGDDKGQVSLFNIENKQCQLKRILKENVGIRVIKFSQRCDALAAGTDAGDLLILDPVILRINACLKSEKSEVRFITFSNNGRSMAYLSGTLGVGFYKYLVDWTFKGKIQAHSKNIVDLLFYGDVLFTIGEDRKLVEYEFRRGLKVKDQKIIEQTAIPTCMIQCKEYLLLANTEYKIRLIDIVTKEIMWTFVGPDVSCIKNMINIKGLGVIFSAGAYLGLTAFPNFPMYHLTLAHTPKIIHIVATANYVFTATEKATSVLMWSVADLKKFKEPILRPLNMFLDVKIENFFEAGPLPRNEIITQFRYLGYFPTDFEIKNILAEVTEEYIDEETFKSLFRNHRPLFGLSIRDIKHCVRPYCANIYGTPSIVVSEMVAAIETCEEPLTQEKTIECLTILSSPAILLKEIPYTEFMVEVLGVSEELRY